jgi:hypothetical protein
MNNLIIKRSQIVEFQVTGTPSTFKRYGALPNPQLQRNNVILYGFECFTADQLIATPSGNATIASTTADQVVVTLVDTNKDQFVYNFPITSLIRTTVGGFVCLIKPRLINLNDCFIQLTDAAGITTDEVVAFNFYYDLVGE